MSRGRKAFDGYDEPYSSDESNAAGAGAGAGVVVDGDEFDDEHMWMKIIGRSKNTKTTSLNELCTGLKNLDNSLRCGICLNFYHAPVLILGCHHTYCSECIRTRFKDQLQCMTSKKEASCPSCRHVVDTTGRIPFAKCLVPNRAVEIISTQFQQVRPLLYNLLLTTTTQHGGTTSPRSTRTNDTTELFSSNSNTHTTQTHASNDNNNNNIDSTVLQEKIRPVLYSAHKKKKLQEMCAELGLSTTGTEKELIHRHEAFINLYNADCDSIHPRSKRQIANEINRRERARMHNKIDSTTAKCIEQLKQSRAKIGVVDTTNEEKKVTLTSGNKDFDKTLNNNFKQMIEQLKARKLLEAKNKEKHNNTDDNSNSTVTHTIDNLEAKDDLSYPNKAEVNSCSNLNGIHEYEDTTGQKKDDYLKNNLLSDNKVGDGISKSKIGTKYAVSSGEELYNNKQEGVRSKIGVARVHTTSSSAKKPSMTSVPGTEPSSSSSSVNFKALNSSNSIDATTTLSTLINDTSKKRSSNEIYCIDDDSVQYEEQFTRRQSQKIRNGLSSSSSRNMNHNSDIRDTRKTNDTIVSLTGPWNCRICTFRNVPSNQCAICHAPRSDPCKSPYFDFE